MGEMGAPAMGRNGESGSGGLFLSALERRTLLCPLRLVRPLCPLSRHAVSPIRPFAGAPFRLLSHSSFHRIRPLRKNLFVVSF